MELESMNSSESDEDSCESHNSSLEDEERTMNAKVLFSSTKQMATEDLPKFTIDAAGFEVHFGDQTMMFQHPKSRVLQYECGTEGSKRRLTIYDAQLMLDPAVEVDFVLETGPSGNTIVAEEDLIEKLKQHQYRLLEQ
ncbi:unnamed protein product, partial [Mesorhabditis belari]|uniref:Uncharacterized protein n=1 Tax=Mesorhabditis belari TaxID=2138241 RepID=A0AAF3ED08_9BILA